MSIILFIFLQELLSQGLSTRCLDFILIEWTGALCVKFGVPTSALVYRKRE